MSHHRSPRRGRGGACGGTAPAACVPLAAALALTLCGATPARADAVGRGAAPPRQAKSLQAVTVAAARGQASPLDPNLPAPVESVTAAQLAQRNVVNAEDALKYLPAFGIRKRFIGDENSTFSVRGTSNQQSARELVYLDGLLLSNLMGNSWSYPPRWSMVFPDDLARVDVIYGAYSALYPGNAIGAVVTMTTRMPDKLETSAQTQLFSQHFRMDGVDRDYGGAQTRATLGDRVGRLSFLLGVTHLQSNGQPLVFATQNLSSTPATAAAIPVTGAIAGTGANGKPRVILGTNSEGQEATAQDEAKLKLAYDVTPTLQGGFTFGYWHQELDHRTSSFLRDAGGRPVDAGTVAIDGRQYQLAPAFFAPGSRASENYLYGVSLGSHRASGWNVGLDASYFGLGKNQDRLADSALAVNGPGQITLGDGSRWRTLDLRAGYTPSSVAPGTHTLSFGYHYDGYALKSDVFRLDTWQHGDPGAPLSRYGGSTQTQALYAQDAWRLAERWQLTYGLRYERWRAFDGVLGNGAALLDYPARRESHPSPKLSLAYQAAADLRLRLSLAHAYRFPTVGELFQGSISGVAIVDNDPHLKPENDLSRELSAEWYRGSGVARFSLYQSDTRNALFSQTDVTVTPNVTSVQNVDKVRTRGAEVSYDGQGVLVPKLDISANAAYTQATVLDDRQFPAAVGKQFYRIPRWRANLVATWHASERTALTLAGRYSSRQYNTLDHSDVHPDTFGGASAFLVWDAKLVYRPSAHLDLGLGIDNLTNRRYYVYYPYPLRSVMAEAKLHW